MAHTTDPNENMSDADVVQRTRSAWISGAMYPKSGCPAVALCIVHGRTTGYNTWRRVKQITTGLHCNMCGSYGANEEFARHEVIFDVKENAWIWNNVRKTLSSLWRKHTIRMKMSTLREEFLCWPYSPPGKFSQCFQCTLQLSRLEKFESYAH
jgi:pyruvate-formate lyase